MSKHEPIIYWSNEDDAFLVEMPELPCCRADCNTCEEAVKNTEEIIKLWIETARSLGRKIPKPRGRLA